MFVFLENESDPPAVNEENRFHAYIWNDGVRDVTNLAVTYSLVSPPGVGDNGKFEPIWTRYISGMVAGNRTRVNWDGSQGICFSFILRLFLFV